MLKKSVIAIAGFLVASQAHAQFDLNVDAYVIGHFESGKVVLEKNPHKKIEPASLTKMMTLALLFEALDNGTVTMETELPISEKAWRKGGSKMFLEVGKTVKVKDLIHGIAVASGNDACIVVAEFLGGDEEVFAGMMNRKAEELGLVDTHFSNASGWPHPEQLTTAHDMYLLGKHLVQKYPEYYSVFSEKEFTYNDIKQYNRNLLLSRGIGVDGLKTGHVENAGYHQVTSAKRGEDRLIATVMSASSMPERAKESAKLLNYVFTNYTYVQLMSAGEAVELDVPVVDGDVFTVSLLAEKNLFDYIPRRDEKKLRTTTTFTQPLVAPLSKGDVVGEATITNIETGQIYTTHLLVDRDVAEIGFVEKMKRKLGF